MENHLAQSLSQNIRVKKRSRLIYWWRRSSWGCLWDSTAEPINLRHANKSSSLSSTVALSSSSPSSSPWLSRWKTGEWSSWWITLYRLHWPIIMPVKCRLFPSLPLMFAPCATNLIANILNKPMCVLGKNRTEVEARVAYQWITIPQRRAQG